MVKSLRAIALAAVLVAMPATAFAAGSISSSNGKTVSVNGGGTSGSGSSSSVTTFASSAAQTVTTTTVTTASGAKVTVEGAATNNSGVTTGLVDNGSGASVAVGVSATAGLPESAVTTINSLNAGNLSVPGVDLTGKAAYGSTVAVRAEAGNVAVSIYVSTLPADGVVQILFYNNYSGTWSLIDAVVDPATSTVTFTAPISGTALVVG